MAGFQCPYCQITMAISDDTAQSQFTSFDGNYGIYQSYGDSSRKFGESCVEIKFYKCPSCGKYTIFAEGRGEEVSAIDTILQPVSLAKQFPEYIPVSIREDYEEACAIVSLSPKASATLSRRCLQGMIRDFWGIKRKRLLDEIDALQELVPEQQWKVLNSIRRMGNFAAHPDADINCIVDIDPSDAKKLISVIELLIKQWYIDRHDEEELYEDVLNIDSDIQTKRLKDQ